MSFRSTMLALLGGSAVTSVAVTNALILGLTYPHGATPTVTDNNGNTWPASPAVTADNGVGNYVAAIFVLPNVKPGQTALTVSFGTTQTPFNYALTEVSNIAPSSPVDVSHGAAGVTGPTLAAGAMTTNQANDFVWSYFPLGAAAAGNPSNFSSANGTILDADIAWINNAGFPHASQWQLQAAAGSVNAGITATAGTGSANSYNCVAVALKTTGTPKIIQHVASSADPAGVGGPAGDNYLIPLPNPCGNANPTGLYINRINHFTMAGTIGAGTWKLQLPVVGNYILLPIQVGQTSLSISGITDSEGNTWSQIAGGASSGFPQYWAAPRTAGSNPNLIISITITANSGGASPSMRAMDLSGVNASPVDATATATASANNLSSVSNQPSIAVPTAGDLVVATMAIGQGPGIAVTSPSGAVFDLCTFITIFTGSVSGTVLTAGAPTQGTIEVGMNLFGNGVTAGITISSFGTGSGGAGTYNLSANLGTINSEAMTCGETDANLIENADAHAHLYNASAATLNWNWNITFQSTNSVNSTAVAIKSA